MAERFIAYSENVPESSAIKLLFNEEERETVTENFNNVVVF